MASDFPQTGGHWTDRSNTDDLWSTSTLDGARPFRLEEGKREMQYLPV